MSKTFKKLIQIHQGNITDKWSLYINEWDRIFKPYRDKQIDLLEIGIQNGGSLEIWSSYFQKAGKLIGCDIDPKCEQLRYDDTRVAVIVGDANSDDCEIKILQQARMFDIVIDDGSHRSIDIVRSFARYFPHLNDGGIYVVEDLHSSYWENYGGGLHNPLSAMSFFKRLTDILNKEHWRNNKQRVDLLTNFSAEFGINFDEFDLTRIHSIEFVNSLCIIKKLPPDKNVLGKRIIAGSVEAVTSGWFNFNNTSIQDVGSDIDIKDDGNLDVFELIVNIQSLNKQVAEHEQAARTLTAQLGEHEQAARTLTAQLGEHEQAVQTLTAQLGEHEQAVQTLTAKLGEREQAVETLTSQLTEREQAVEALTSQLAERKQAVEALTSQLAERKQAVEALTSQLAEREKAVQALTAQLGEGEQALQALRAQLAEREQAVQVLTARLTEREQAVKTLTAHLAERNQTVQELNVKVSELDQEVQELTAQVTEHVQATNTLTALVAEREQALETQISQAAEREQALTNQAMEQEKQLNVLAGQNQEITTSKAWRAALLLRRLRIFLLPPGSLRLRLAKKMRPLLLLPFNLRRSYQRNQELRLIRNSDLFDPDWYLANNPDVAQAGLDPSIHFVHYGGFEGRDPGPDFNSAWYLEKYEDIKKAGINPLLHYVKYGRREGRHQNSEDFNIALIGSSGLFDPKWYLAHNPDVAQTGMDPLIHFVRFGGFEGRDPGPNFSSVWYLEQNEDVNKAGINPLLHYLEYGRKEGRQFNSEEFAFALVGSSGLFDRKWYLAHNPDVARAGMDPLIHYIRYGGFEGRDPNPIFHSSLYFERNPEAKEARINPLIHYLSKSQQIRNNHATTPERSKIDDIFLDDHILAIIPTLYE